MSMDSLRVEQDPPENPYLCTLFPSPHSAPKWERPSGEEYDGKYGPE